MGPRVARTAGEVGGYTHVRAVQQCDLNAQERGDTGLGGELGLGGVKSGPSSDSFWAMKLMLLHPAAQPSLDVIIA